MKNLINIIIDTMDMMRSLSLPACCASCHQFPVIGKVASPLMAISTLPPHAMTNLTSRYAQQARHTQTANRVNIIILWT